MPVLTEHVKRKLAGTGASETNFRRLYAKGIRLTCKPSPSLEAIVMGYTSKTYKKVI